MGFLSPLIPANAETQIIWRGEKIVFSIKPSEICHLDPGIRRDERV
jgi:hypothetical protein